jgi:hypothetical protein
MQPLSTGNVVSAALRIYRDRFKTYYLLAFQAALWSIVPVYGWAKSASLLGLISRLVFHEVIERPESIADARQKIEPKMWEFLASLILMSLIFFGVIFGSIFALVIIGAILRVTLGDFFTNNPLILILLILVTIFAWLFGYIWLISRLLLTQLPIAIENNVSPASAIGRSWQLTNGFVFKIQIIVFVALLVSFPLWMSLFIVYSTVQLLFTFVITDAPALEIIASLVVIALNLVANALITPFWQAIQAIIYYDLRVRHEGMGMKIRDSLS